MFIRFIYPMKDRVSLQLCLGLVLFLGSLISITTSTLMQWTINCHVLSVKQAYCSRTAGPSTVIPTIPMHKVKPEVEHFEAHLSLDGPWMINDTAMFQNFTSLINVRLVGPIEFTPPLDTAQMKNHVGNTLFQPLPNLKKLALWYWNATDDFNWKFPESLTDLQLIRCPFTKLNLSSNTNLNSLSVRLNNLTEMPILSSPPPPLEKLYLAGNRNISFTVNDLKYLCKLRAVSITEFNARLNETAKYCECHNLKTYFKRYRIKEIEVFDCSKGTSSIDCKDYRIDRTFLEHDEICKLTKPTTSTMTSSSTTITTSTTLQSSTTIQSTTSKPTATQATTTTQLITSTNATTISTTSATTLPTTTTMLTTLPETPSTSSDDWDLGATETLSPPVVCVPCPGCTVPVIGWSFFTLVLLSAGAGVATYVVVKRRLLFFN